MQTKEYTKETGMIKNFKLYQEFTHPKMLDKNKPSSIVFRRKKSFETVLALIDIDRNHNWSWYREISERAKKNPEALALFYRGTRVSFQEMLTRSDEIAKSLKACGIEPGDEIPCCLSNTPEFVYFLLAANKVGAKVNLFGTHLDKDYLGEILDSCTGKLFIGTDDTYAEIKDMIGERTYKNKILISLADSLPKEPEKTLEYEPSLKEYYHYDNLVPEFQREDKDIMTFSTFSTLGKDIEKVYDNNDLDTEFLITYTSGSTKIGHPKQIIHTNRSLIVSGRFHDSELSGNPELTGLRGLAHIHTDSNTNVITCISDNLMQLWSVALEPEYDSKKALDYIFLNKPNYLNITTSFLIEASKQYLLEKRFHENGKGRKLGFLLAAFAVGEGVSKGEEKFINKFLREGRAGSSVKMKGFSMPFTTLSVGGGDCEHGGIYYSLWRSLYEKLNYFKLSKHSYGLQAVPYVQVSAFKERLDGEYAECDINEMGLIAANSPTTMKGYKNNAEATEELIIRDNKGRDWVSSNVYGYVDECGSVHVKGRIGNELICKDGKVVPAYMIEDVVGEDTKNIMSCTVTQAVDGEEIIPVVNIEFQPGKDFVTTEKIAAIMNRAQTRLPEEICEKLSFRIFSSKHPFPLTGSGKRSFKELEQMGLNDVFRLCDGNMIPVQEQKEIVKSLTLTKK